MTVANSKAFSGAKSQTGATAPSGGSGGFLTYAPSLRPRRGAHRGPARCGGRGRRAAAVARGLAPLLHLSSSLSSLTRLRKEVAYGDGG